MASLKSPKSLPELESLLASKPNGLFVLDFWATWCAPCHTIAPIFEKLSNEYPHVTFIKIDVDALPEISSKYEITAMPTFKFIRNDAVIQTVMGADKNGLSNGVQTHAGPEPLTSSSASAVAVNIAPPSKAEGASSGDISLLEFLETNQLNCLNEAPEHSIKTILSSKGKTSSKSFLQSDTDEQLLLNIYFNQVVRVRSIVIQASSISSGPEESSSGPKKIKLFINKPSLGFEDVEDAEEPAASQVLEISEDTLKNGTRIPLRFVRFQSVNSLHIFVASNHGGEDKTNIDVIDIFGVPVQVTKNLSGLAKAGEEHNH